MRVAIIESGIVLNVVELPDTAVIADDKASAAIPAEAQIVDHDNGPSLTQYQAIFSQPGTTLVESDAAGLGWHYDGSAFAAPMRSLGDVKAAALAAARAHFGGLIAAGFALDGVLYALDPQSLQNATAAGAQAGMVVLGATGFTWLAGFTYPSAAGVPQAMTAAQMATLANNLFHYVAGCDQQLASIVAAIVAAANVGAVNAIDVTAGYPTASA